MNLKIFFSRTIGPISTKLGTKHPCVIGIPDCSNDGPCPFPRGDNYEIAKVHSFDEIKKVFFLLMNIMIIIMCLSIFQEVFSCERCGP